MPTHVNLYLLPSAINIRDAVHVPVISGTAGGDFDSGQPVRYFEPTKVWHACELADAHGVVNPWQADVKRGDLLWILISPNTISELQHVWNHPILGEATIDYKEGSMASADQKAASEEWLQKFCRESDCPRYEIMIAAALGKWIEGVDGYGGAYTVNDYGDGESYLHFAGRDAHGSIPPEFWDHVEIVTGEKCPERPLYFSCSC